MTAWGEHQSIVLETYKEASDHLGFNLWKIVSEGPETDLNNTEVTQPAMLCAGVASWRVIQQSGNFPQAQMMAGHSLGEYTALVCSQSLTLGDAVKLVAKRGSLMQTAVAAGEGSMAAIIGLDDEDVIRACNDVHKGVVEAVNFNAPGQVVIAGNKKSVEQAMENSKKLGAKRALPLPVSVPSHCSLMQQAAEQLGEELNALDIVMPQVPIIHNQNAAVADSVTDIQELLKKQLYQPVKWVECVNNMHIKGVENLVECGPGKVLSGLTRRINKALQGHAVYDVDSLNKTIESLTE